MMGSITGHTGTENQHRPMALNGCMWLWDAGLWLLQESDLGGVLLCGKSVRPHYGCLYDQRSQWPSCLTEFQRGKWTSWWSTSGLKRTAVVQLAFTAGRQQTATHRCFKPCRCSQDFIKRCLISNSNIWQTESLHHQLWQNVHILLCFGPVVQ